MKVLFEGEVWELKANMGEYQFKLVQINIPDMVMKITQEIKLVKIPGAEVTLILKTDFVEIKNLTLWKPG